MNITTIELKKLTAYEGMTLTNGKTFGKTVYLADGASCEDWYEITDAEAEQMMRKQEEVLTQ